jgi:2-polyprenyl-3-methyl-5-hydroxy-6-metoxy-1,4-benzoquinol methylase
MAQTSSNHWRERVLRHTAQAEEAQTGPDGLPLEEDAWEGLAGRFRADPLRKDDPLVERIAAELGPDKTLLDVGGGAGRLALPLAFRCRRVTVMDGSEAMIKALRAGADEAGIDNVLPFFGTWMEDVAPPADVVLCAHVVYTEPEIEGFIDKLDAHARKTVLMPTFEHGPQAQLTPLWQLVYGEERVGLPGLDPLVAVLEEMGLNPSVEPAEVLSPRAFQSPGAAVEHVRPRMFVRPGGERDRKLRAAVDELLVEEGARYRFAGAEPQNVSLVSWTVEDD